MDEVQRWKDAFEEITRLSFDQQIKLQQLENRFKAESKPKKFKVVTLCGSTRFKDQFNQMNEALTLDGNVVISVGVFGHADGVYIKDDEKEMLDKIHFQKIDMADEIFVINVGGYIGSSTKNEIAYAKSQGKPIKYYENLNQ